MRERVGGVSVVDDSDPSQSGHTVYVLTISLLRIVGFNHTQKAPWETRHDWGRVPLPSTSRAIDGGT